MFKLHYHLETTTSLSITEVTERFINGLEKQDGYRIKSAKEDSVFFEDKQFHARSSIDGIGRIDEGKLFVEIREQIVVCLDTYLNYGYYLFLALACIAGALAIEAYGPLFFLLIIAIAFVFKLTAVRSTAREKLRSATNRVELSLSEDSGVLKDGLFF